MSFIFTSIKFYDEFTELSGGGVGYLNGGVGDKYFAIIEGYTYLAYTGKKLRFTAADKTIEMIDELDFSSFLDDGNLIGKGLSEGREIAIEGTDDNDGSFTIASISEDGRIITVVEALVDEDALDADIFDDTVITALDFYYNIIPNNGEETYQSLTDKGNVQRFTIDDIYASDGTPMNMRVASPSFGWLTNSLIDETTGETDEVTVEGVDIVDHKQKFKIYQEFKIAPVALAEQINNFSTMVAPEYLKGGILDINSLKYICKVDAKFEFSDPDIPHSGSSTDTLGRVNWYNQNNIRSRPEYYLDQIIYADEDGFVDSLDIEKVVAVGIIIKSRNGKFQIDPYTKYSLQFNYLPLNESRYQNTPDTTLIQNLLIDKVLQEINATGNGENFGTAYQVIQSAVASRPDANTLYLIFEVNFSTEIKEFLKTLDEENRNFFFSITTQDLDVTNTIQSDRVQVLTPINQIAWDKSNPDLIEAVDNLRVYHYPDIDTNPKNSVGGWEGDPVYLEFPFRLYSPEVAGCQAETVTPTIKRAGFQICITRPGETDFVLEEKIFDTSQVRKLEGTQTIDIEEIRNYIGMPDEYNIISLKRDASFDGSDPYKGFVARHALVLRYDWWNRIISEAEQFQYCVASNIENPTEAWNTLQQNGWSLQVRFLVEVEGYTGFSEVFDQYWDIDCLAPGDDPDEEPFFTSEVKYEIYDPLDTELNEVVINGINKGGKTLITRTYTGNTAGIPVGFNAFFAYLFADIETQGGTTNRKFVSTEIDSTDADCPFSAPDADPDADESWASANLRINIFNFTRITVTTIYDDTKNEWSNRAENVLLFPKLGVWNNPEGDSSSMHYYL